MTDRADLIDKLKRWAWSEQQSADDAKRIYPKASEWYADRAALLREAAKALAVALAEAGATPHQIAAWTGHTTLKEVTDYTAAVDRRKAVMG